mmetsp:Transcript_14841/g.42768  ORF Transcript_14841/g.42768 Transcript_14841/m.42768 type:complete len:285 (+) Transcript_14841:58-912(+)
MAPLKGVLIHLLAGAKNEEAAVVDALVEQGTLSTGLRVDSGDVEFIVGTCDPEVGQYVKGRTEVIVGDQTLRVFKKVHVLPYLDTFAYNNDLMYFENIKPYFDTKQRGEFSVGFDFAYKGVRFSVVGTEPADSFGVVGRDTIVFYEGPAIERSVLDRVQLVPFEDGLPEKYRPTKLSLDEQGLVRDYLRPYFEQRSAVVAPGEVLEIQGVRFKVVATRPSSGGGFGRDTELACQGVALRAAFSTDPAAKAKAKGKAKAKAGALPGGVRPAPGGSDGSGGGCAIS